jgi:hypothetical protein
MKVLITGSVNFPDLDLVKEFVKTLSIDTILYCGRMEGVDNVARNQALFQDLIVIDIPVTKSEFTSRVPKIIGYDTLVDLVDEVHIFTNGNDGQMAILSLYAEKTGKLINFIIDRGEA